MLTVVAGGRARGNLPAPASEFVGRLRELDEVHEKFRRARVVTLTGPGGVGKTRLGLKLATAVREQYSGGAWWVDLAPLREPNLLTQHVAQALDVPPHDGNKAAEALRDHVSNMPTLLVLDNCEHLTRACAKLVDYLLKGAPDLRILATSRQRLAVDGEVLYSVLPLSLPARRGGASDSSHPVHQQRSAEEQPHVDSEALTLFAQRASQVTSFSLTSGNYDAVVDVCRMLDGLPLAIELAVPWLRTLTTAQLRDQLRAHRFGLLQQEGRVGHRHQQTLEGLIGWSYEQCTPQEQGLWQRLSVFVDEFDFAAAAAVCGHDLDQPDLIDALGGLVEKSVLLCDKDNPTGEPRYHLLETIREFGWQELKRTQPDAETEIRQRHRRCYQTLAAEAGDNWHTAKQAIWHARLLRDHGNVRAALTTCLDDPEHAQDAVQICADLVYYWVFSGRHVEAQLWIDQALALNPQPTERHAAGLATAVFISSVQGKQAKAKELLRDYQAMVAQLRLDPTTLKFLQGTEALLSGALPKAVPLLEEAREGYRRAPRGRGHIHIALLFLALTHGFRGKAEAKAASAECLRDALDALAEWNISWARFAVGLARWQHSAEAAMHEWSQAIRNRLPGDAWGLLWLFEALAWGETRLGNYHRAAVLLGITHARRKAIGLDIGGLVPFEQLHRRYEDKVLESLGREAYDTAVDRGVALGASDAGVGFALGEDTGPTGGGPRQGLDPSALPTDKLTNIEREIAVLVYEGLPNASIAQLRGVSENTVKKHVASVLAKLGLRSRTQIAKWIAEHHQTSQPRSSPRGW
ncbi:LuxR C-terminal-related transcriptional regulator [Saccharopolyspora sp. K220]|uniref:LuxR C-terminal-related transcriptional regulator n=1 Tax=Saccharopolyspora soli TaxID=2926618 RepID=UPI001F59AFEE|nr:LuxR C-terminal-related transcriptional regulator [Saccharopolyspora soli]MCI2416632.1 LuxR C-terminal-related transcriptional regulator [Saccharopolyspora soli]